MLRDSISYIYTSTAHLLSPTRESMFVALVVRWVLLHILYLQMPPIGCTRDIVQEMIAVLTHDD